MISNDGELHVTLERPARSTGGSTTASHRCRASKRTRRTTVPLRPASWPRSIVCSSTYASIWPSIRPIRHSLHRQASVPDHACGGKDSMSMTLAELEEQARKLPPDFTKLVMLEITAGYGLPLCGYDAKV